MKPLLLVMASVAGFVSALADDAPIPQAPTGPITATEIARAKVQELVRVSVQLTLQEVAIEQTTPVDNDKLALVRAQQSAVKKSLVAIVLGPLELELQRASASFPPGHHRVIELQKQIETAKASLSASLPN
jgi:hypothetical protein